MERFEREQLVLGPLLRERARLHGDRVFLRFRDGDLTYREVDEAADSLAAGLHQLGVRTGDKVSLMLPNCPEFVFAAFALARLGAVEVPINTAYKGDLLEHVIVSSDSTALIIEEEWLERVVPLEGRLSKLERVVVRGAAGAANKGSKMETVLLGELMRGPPKFSFGDVTHAELQAIMYTSGTTGPSKGVMVSHAQACTLALEFSRFVDFRPDDVIYTPLPLFHGIAHSCGVVAALLAGSSVAIVERFSASRFWDDVRRFKATVGHGIFSMFHILLNQPPRADDRDHSLRCMWLGQSAVDQAFAERFGTRVVETYGSTEVGICTGSPYGEWRPGSCGRENSETYQVGLFNEHDREVATGQVGELVVRSPVAFAITSGYYNFPDATVETFRNLWFHTGDLAFRDDDGYFFFVDRKKDSIRRRGENVSAYEVERVLNANEAVLESAAVAVPAELGEDEIKACVVLQPGARVSPEDLLAFCDERMPRFMVPRYVEFLDELPKTATEKIEKYRLRAEGDHGITKATWDREKAGFRFPQT